MISVRIVRPGEKPEDNDWRYSSPAERIEGVWLLTKICLLWNRFETDEPRLQRTITRVQRRTS
jgi:hypothetical protein